MWLQKDFGPNCGLEIDKEFYSSIHYYGTADGTEVEGRNIYYAFRSRHNLRRPPQIMSQSKCISECSFLWQKWVEKVKAFGFHVMSPSRAGSSHSLSWRIFSLARLVIEIKLLAENDPKFDSQLKTYKICFEND